MRDSPPTAKRGERGEAVTALQCILSELGLEPGGEPGTFTAGTEEGLRRFQRMVGLPETGELDERTSAALFAREPLPAATTLRRNPANPYQRHLLPDDRPPARGT